MLPGAYDLNLYRGDTTRFRFVLWQDAAKTVPYDLSAATAASQIRDRPDGSVVVQLDCAITPPNTINVTVPAGSSSLQSKGVWDLQLSWTGGDVLTVVTGAVYAMADVTR